MQRQWGNGQDELRRTQQQLYDAEEERDRAVDELREMKRVAQEANMRLSEALSSKRSGDLYTELSTAKKSLSDATRELQIKDKSIETLRLELEKVRLVELKLAERDAAIDKLKKELNIAKISEGHTADSLSESKARIQELEVEVETRKDSEAKVFDSLVSQTKHFEQAKMHLEESKLEIASLNEKVKILEDSCGRSGNFLESISNRIENSNSRKEELQSLRCELRDAKANLDRARNAEQLASLQNQTMLQEIAALKTELRQALEAEDKSKKAMDDLALALAEVAGEANQAKENLISTREELENAKSENEQLKQTLKSSQSKNQALLDEARQEIERHKNTIDRLNSEAGESANAWNLKESELINCMKEAEMEKMTLQEENAKLAESTKAAEDMRKTSREDNHKLRDILKQAINESNVAKEAAAIARAENSRLKDSLSEKDDALEHFIRENERLRVNETVANENVKELKHLLSTASAKEVKVDDFFKEVTEVPEAADVTPHKTTAKAKVEDKEVAEAKTNKLHLSHIKVKTEDKEVTEAKNHKPPASAATKDVAEVKNHKPPASKEAGEVKSHKPAAKVKSEDKDVAEVVKAPKPQKEHHHHHHHHHHHSEGKKSRKTFSFDLEELKVPAKTRDEEEEFLIEEALKGSIFDTESPTFGMSHHQRKMSASAFTDDGEADEFDHMDGHDDGEPERSSHRKKKALLRRFGDLIIRRRSFHQKSGPLEKIVPLEKSGSIDKLPEPS